MHDGAASAFECFDGAADQGLAGGGEDFERHVIGNMTAFDELAHKIKVGLRGRGKGDFDFLEANIAESLEHAHLALAIHWLEQRLIPVAKIGTHPDRCLGYGAIGPLPVIEFDRGKGGVFGIGVLQHFVCFLLGGKDR